MPFWQFFRLGRDGRAQLVWPSRIPHRISKILFALGADEFLAMLESKIREGLFFKVRSGKITVWTNDFLRNPHFKKAKKNHKANNWRKSSSNCCFETLSLKKRYQTFLNKTKKDILSDIFKYLFFWFRYFDNHGLNIL